MPSGWNIYNNKEGLLQNSVIPAFAGMTYLRFLQEAQEHQDLSCVEMTIFFSLLATHSYPFSS